MNKKAFSNIAVTVLLVLLAVIAITIVALALRNIIGPTTLSPGFSCLDLQLGESVSIEKTCYNSATYEVETTLKRNLDTEINSLDFVLNLGLESSSWSCTQQCSNCDVLSEGETKTYYFIVGNFNINEENTFHVLTENCLLDTKNIREC